MGAPSPPTPSVDKPADRLDSWKEIAEYLHRDVTTVQRWERREKMPVHRHQHDRAGSVYAYRSDLDAWVCSRSVKRTTETGNGTAGASSEITQARPSRPILVIALISVALMAIAAAIWLEQTEYSWQSPIAGARFQRITDFDATAEAAAISRDGKFVAFLSDREGKMDVWITQVGSGEFHNLTHGDAPELVNPSVRSLGFSPDGSLVLYWVRQQQGMTGADISIWAVPTLGGEPRPYLDGAAELDWSPDGSRLAYHLPGPGDPLFVSEEPGSQGHLIFTAPPGLHSHFPTWSPDSAFIYFVEGTLPDSLDIWRIRPGGGKPERITSQNSRVSHPVLLNRRTLVYLATNGDGSGPWLYSLDLDRRIPHQLTSGLDRYTSLAASADGRRLVLTLANPKSTLWSLHIGNSSANSRPAPISLTTSTGSFPRLGQNYLVYVSAADDNESIWKVANGTSTKLWTGQGAKILDGPAVSADGDRIAFSVEQRGRSLLYVMASDGTNQRVVFESLALEGAPAWAPDGNSIIAGVDDRGVPRLYRVPLNGGAAVPFASDYSLNPTWAPDGSYAVYSGPDIGTNFSVKAISADASAHPIPALTLTRGTRHLAFVDEGRALVVLQGEIQHKNLWLIDLQTGARQQLTNFPADFDVRDFDVSPDGHDVVLERTEAHSDVVLLDRARR